MSSMMLLLYSHPPDLRVYPAVSVASDQAADRRLRPPRPGQAYDTASAFDNSAFSVGFQGIPRAIDRPIGACNFWDKLVKGSQHLPAVQTRTQLKYRPT